MSAKTKQQQRRRRQAAKGQRRREAGAEPATAGDGRVTFETSVGPIEISTAARGLLDLAPEGIRPEDMPLLDLTDCDARVISITRAVALNRLVEAEGLHPAVAKALGRTMPQLLSSLEITGERGRMLDVAPTLRRVRRIELYLGDDHAALMGMIHELPLVCLAEYQNGRAAETAAEELAEAAAEWKGWILVTLLCQMREGTPSIGLPGRHIAAHEVVLDRPVLWHRGER